MSLMLIGAAAGAMGQGGAPPTPDFGIASITQSNQSTNVTTHVVSLPATVSAGDYLLILMQGRGLSGNPGFSIPPATWTAIPSVTNQSGNNSLAGFYKVASGTEGGSSVSVSSSNSCQSVSLCLRVPKASGVTGRSNAHSTNTLNPNPPSVASGFSGNILWIAGYGWNNVGAPSGYPTGFADNQTHLPNAGSVQLSIVIASRFDVSATVDPSVFTAPNAGGKAFTVAVQPA